jgi:hypothetical protein
LGLHKHGVRAGLRRSDLNLPNVFV